METAQASPKVIVRRASKRWNDDQLREAIIGVDRYSEVAKKLGLFRTTKNYHRLADRAAVLGLDTSRIDHYSSRRANPCGPIGLLEAVTDEDFARIVASSSSWPEVVGKIGYSKKASRANWLAKRRGDDLGLEFGHFKDGGQRLVQQGYEARKARFILRLVPNSSSARIGKRLVEFGLKDHRCECCGITEWMGQEAPLQLDHIDGNNRNNVLENLRMLCPNCHMQTETWGFKNSRRRPEPKAPEAT